MAGNLQTYALAYLTIENALLSQEGSVSLRRTTGSQPVHTVANGYSGESPGSPMCEAVITSAVPLATIEYDPGVVMLGLIPVELGVIMAGKTAKSKGFIHEDEYQHAVDQAAKQTLHFRGRFPTFA
jgi:hypothetical protein